MSRFHIKYSLALFTAFFTFWFISAQHGYAASVSGSSWTNAEYTDSYQLVYTGISISDAPYEAVVSSIVVSWNVDSNYISDIEWYLDNSNGYSSDWYTDMTSNGDDYLDGYTQSSDGSKTIYPSSDEPVNGTWWFNIMDTYDDTNPDWNLGRIDSWSITINYTIPADLDVIDVDAVGGTYEPGDSIVVYNEIKNIGGETSSSYTISFYASTNTTISTSDYKLGSITRSGLAPSGVHKYNSTVYFPPNGYDGSPIPDNDYYIGVIVSCSNDSDTGNNTDYDFYRITTEAPKYPDLIVNSVSGPGGTYAPGDKIDATAQIKNDGLASAGSSHLDYWLGTATTKTYQYIEEGAVSSLSPGSTDNDMIGDYITGGWTIPSGIPDGTYRIWVEADSRDEILNEEDESNNWGYSSDFTIQTPPADLYFQSLDVPSGTYHPGDSIDVVNIIQNIGAQASGSYTVDFYASTDTTISSSDYKIGHVSRDSLAAGGTHSYSTTVYFPPNSYDGGKILTDDYYIVAIINCSGDGDTGNNSKYDSSTIRIRPETVRVYGTMRYKDRSGNSHPIRYAVVKVFDDNLVDEKIGQTTTDENGYYSITVDVDEDDGEDIYVKVYTEGDSYAFPGSSSKIANVSDSLLSFVYSMGIDTFPNYLGYELEISLTADNASDEGGAFAVYDSVVEGFVGTYNTLNVEMQEVTVYWPAELAPTSHLFGIINIERDFTWDRDTVLHEYGHFVGEYNDFADAPVSSFNHNFFSDWRDLISDEEEARQGAFKEAWASFFAVAIQRENPSCRSLWDPLSSDTTVLPHDSVIRACANDNSYSWYEQNLETMGYWTTEPGEYFERHIMGALWDIYDSNNEIYIYLKDDLDLGINAIWAICTNNNIQDIYSFWDNWFGVPSYGSNREITSIMYFNSMKFIAQIPLGHSPNNESTDQPLSVDLNWDDALNAQSYDVYFGTDPTPDAGEFQGNVEFSSWSLPTLDPDTTYYWQIIARDEHAEAESPVWSFTTTAAPALEVAPTNRNVSSGSGITTFSVANTGSGTMNWSSSVISGGSWLTITSGTSGTDSGTISCAYTANTGGERVGVIRVDAGTATDSPIDITVTQAAADMPILEVSPASSSVSAYSGTTSFLVSNTGSGTMAWTATVIDGSSWLSISSGSSGIDSGTINCAFTTNSGEQRVGTIRIVADGVTGSPMDVTVVQAGADTPILDVSPTVRNVNSDSGETSFSVTNEGSGTMDWTASILSGGSWLTITSGTSGTGNGTINCSFTANAGDQRTGTIRVEANGVIGSPVDITVTQAAADSPVLNVSPGSLTASPESGVSTLTITNNGTGTMNWSATVLPGGDWLTITSGSSGTDNGTVTFSFSANPGLQRTGVIRVEAPGVAGSPMDISITQEAAYTTPVIEVTPSSGYVNSDAGTAAFKVSNIGIGTMEWSATVVSGNDWFEITSGWIGTDDGWITSSYNENTTGEKRTGIIRVEAPGALGSPFDIYLEQNKELNIKAMPWLMLLLNGN